ncbi:unnamed protein product, partial [Prorocentrum cordatum]
ECFRAALAEEPPAALPGASAQVRLRFFGLVPARAWVGRSLRTPCFAVAGGLE